jgi:hypothetical protein
VCREAILKTEANNESMQGPDTFTRIKLLRQGVLIHELMEKRSYEMAKKIARYWTTEGQLVDTPDSKRLREEK